MNSVFAIGYVAMTIVSSVAWAKLDSGQLAKKAKMPQPFVDLIAALVFSAWPALFVVGFFASFWQKPTK